MRLKRILVVDDDAHIRELVCTLLLDAGLVADAAPNGKEALQMLHSDEYGLCILDVMMPGPDGYEILEILRKYYDFPVLMLTAKAETAQKVKGFTLGADDYLTKPFEPAELLVRVKALLKRYNIATSQVVAAGQLKLNRHRYVVEWGGRALEVPMKEFELLFLLASYPGRTLSRDRIMQEVWGYDFEGNERTLDVHVGRLRERFTDAGFRIKTVRGLGYRLEVEE